MGAARVARLLRAERALAVRRDGGRARRGRALPAAGLLRRRGHRGRAHEGWAGEDGGVAAAALAVLAVASRRPAVEWTWEIPGAFVPVVVVAALLCGPALAPGRPRPGRAPRAGGRRGRGRLRLRRGRGDRAGHRRQVRASREAAADGDLARPPTMRGQPPSIQPWAAAPRLQLALVEEERDDPAAAERALRRGDRARAARTGASGSCCHPAAGQRRATARERSGRCGAPGRSRRPPPRSGRARR